MICKTQLSLTAAAIVGALALCAFTWISPTSPQVSIASTPDPIETVARMQQRLLNDRARLSRGEVAAPSRWFDPATESAE